jgi:hypothetical protein
MLGNEAFSVWISAYLTRFPWRRTPPLFKQVTLQLQLAIVLAKPCELGALVAGEPALAAIAIRACLLDPAAECRRRQVEIASDLRDGLAFIEDQAHCASLELIRELPPRALGPALLRIHRPHRIRLSGSVHGSGSSPVYPGVASPTKR